MANNQPQTDIYVIGTGMVGYRQLTQEAIAALDRSEQIYLVHYQKIVSDHMEEYADDVIDLTTKYEQDTKRKYAYEQMAETVLDAAEECDSPITLALYGHPLVFVSPSRWVIEEAPERGLEVQVQPGISSVDCLYTDLTLDPAKNGIQMFEATDLLLREFELNPDVPAMIWQIGMVESVLYSDETSRPKRFKRLREYLQQFYPDDHTAYITQTSTYPITESEQIEFEISEFESLHEQINAIQTLYIPPVQERSIQNEELAELVMSQDHLETITTNE